MLQQFSENLDLAQNENIIGEFWIKNKIYSLIEEKCSKGEIFRFLDGPPFVSSKNLHYGHVHIGMVKSSVLNYLQMKGYNVLNMIGYDVHGLPIEMVVSKILGLSTNAEIKNFGLENYNNKCEEVINNFSGSWKNIFDRIGRFVNFDNEYKTMDLNYMESTWWAFNQLWKKGLVYRGYKIMPYSIECGTSISNSEASGDEVFKEVSDKSIYVKLKVIDQENTYLIIWTTTPWTLPSNLAVGANPEITYCKICDQKSGQFFILGEKSLGKLYGKQPAYTLVEKINVIGLRYEPLFDYYMDKSTDKPIDNKFTIIKASYVTDISGTSLVHLAPAFGQDDYDTCIANGIINSNTVGNYCPIDENGFFTSIVREFQGQKCLNTNDSIIQLLKQKGLLFKIEIYKHRYPHCWRTDTPLIYKSISSFFIKVTDITSKMVHHNSKVNWVPNHIGTKRFQNWIQNATDWGVSRSRFFGTPVPIWISDDNEEMICVGSIDELVKLGGLDQRLTNIHPQYIDKIEFKSSTGKILKWCGQTLDCWFESGCAPFAQLHYPFENSDSFNNREFLCDFICEGLDQTRGWFYTLTVLSVALFDLPAYKNVICNGLILAEDGKKYSKRLENYTDPIDMCNQYSADAIRLYLIGSPAVHAEEVRVEIEQIKKISGKYVQFFNVYNFLAGNIIQLVHNNHSLDLDAYKITTDVTDLWILSRVRKTMVDINAAMKKYTLHKIKPIILDFIEDISNWYVKFNRGRLSSKNTDIANRNCALSTLYHCLMTFVQLIAPFAPFFTESMYQLLSKILPKSEVNPSVHLCDYPSDSKFVNLNLSDNIINNMANLQLVVITIRNLRSFSKTASSGKMPIKNVTISNKDSEFLSNISQLEKYIMREINTLKITYTTQCVNETFKIIPDNKNLGLKFKKDSSKIKNSLDELSQDQIKKYMENKSIGLQIDDHLLDETMFAIVCNQELDLKANEVGKIVGQTGIIVDFTQDEKILGLYTSRKFIRIIQNERKEAKLNPIDEIQIYYQCDNLDLNHAIESNLLLINSEIGYKVSKTTDLENVLTGVKDKIIINKEIKLENYTFVLTIVKQC